MDFKKFSDVKVDKPDVKAIEKEYKAICKKLEDAKDAKQAIQAVEDEFKLSDKINSDYQVASIRHTIDIRDKFYTELTDFYDQNLPYINQFEDEYNHILVKSKFRKEIAEKFGDYMFTKIDMALKTFSPEIIPDLQEENSLASAYNQIMGCAKGIYRGKELPITKFSALLDDKDRSVRKDASDGFWGFYSSHEKELADIYDKMVKVRTKIAKKLGFDNYLPLGYLRLGRSDYTPEDVANYREAFYKNIVPLAQSVYRRQEARLGIKDMKYYDYPLEFNSGNAKPIGTPEQLVEDAKKMYSEMSPVASKYFNFMVSHEMMDLVAKDGKIPGGYMTYIPDLKSSYIFSNFNGSSGDVDVLTHEFGHSLQGFLSADIKVPSLRSPGYELCEIHSMSMEFFAYPWTKYFFGDSDEKYRFSHLADDITFIPYGVSVDEFQAFVYTHPNCTHEERKAAWRSIEKKYMPHRKYGEDNKFLESGGFWMKQLHIYVDPLYYIDYTIAQVGAFEFFTESLTDYKKAFDKYIAFNKLGGQYPYKELLKKAGIADPMVKDTIPSLIPALNKYLDSFDDKKF